MGFCIQKNICTVPSLAEVLSIKLALRSSVHSGTLVRADRHPRPLETDMTDTLVTMRNFKPELWLDTESLQLGFPHQYVP